LNAAHELIFENLVKRGHRIAVFHGHSSITYLDLAQNVNRFGHLLLGLGLRPRERVASNSRTGPNAFMRSWVAFKPGSGRC
jgi:acyl-coenzyme A synthetase/AMP-(fatty) acid ligase